MLIVYFFGGNYFDKIVGPAANFQFVFRIFNFIEFIQAEKGGVAAVDPAERHAAGSGFPAGRNDEIIKNGFIFVKIKPALAAADEKRANASFVCPDHQFFGMRKVIQILGSFKTSVSHILKIKNIFLGKKVGSIAEIKRFDGIEAIEAKNNEDQVGETKNKIFPNSFDLEKLFDADSGQNKSQRIDDDLIPDGRADAIYRRSYIINQDKNDYVKRPGKIVILFFGNQDFES